MSRITSNGSNAHSFAGKLNQHRESDDYHIRQLKNNWKFSYDPLDQSADSIRLVKVLPTSDQDLLKLEIRHANLSAKYTALSYTWGPPDGVRAVLINKMGSEVRYNLWHFLNTMRLENQTGEFWIDALCIDQLNVDEKNHQVQRMGDIYTKAEAVFAWLGEPVLQQVNILFDLARQSRAYRTPPREPQPILMEESKLELHQRWQLVKLCEELCANPYWTRLWVVQEVSLASSLLILWGRCSIRPRNLREYLMELANVSGPGNWLPKYSKMPLADTMFNVVMLLRVCDKRPGKSVGAHDTHMKPFELLLRQFHQHACSETRDRIFGLLSLTSDLAELKVDYSLPRQALFWRVISISCVIDLPKFVTHLRLALKLSRKQAISWFHSHDYSNRIATEPDWSKISVKLILKYASILIPATNKNGPRSSLTGTPLVVTEGFDPEPQLLPKLRWSGNILHYCNNSYNMRKVSVDKLTVLPELSTVFKVGNSSFCLVAHPHKSSAPPEIFAALLMLDVMGADEIWRILPQVKTLPPKSKSVLKMALHQVQGDAKPDFRGPDIHRSNSEESSTLGGIPLIDRTDCKYWDLETSYSTAPQWALRPTWEVLRCLVNVCM